MISTEWLSRPPTSPGLWWVRRLAYYPDRAARGDGVPGVDRGYAVVLGRYSLVGLLFVPVGPRGGARRARWVTPAGEHAPTAAHWPQGWQVALVMATTEQKAQAWDMAWKLLLDACTLPKNPRKAYLVARDPVRVHMLCNVVPSLRRRAAIIRRRKG